MTLSASPPDTAFIFDPNIPFLKKMRRVYDFQMENEPVYRRFCESLAGRNHAEFDPENVPLLPVEAFRDAVIGPGEAPLKFKSSGTTGTRRSVHYVRDPELYKNSILNGMSQFYRLEDYVVLGYTPGYQENPHSSLIWMIKCLIDEDDSGHSRFLMPGKPLNAKLLSDIKSKNRKILLFGAAFGLIDLAEQFPVRLPDGSVIVETGGMKTHRREIARDELHRKLADSFGLDAANIHSEYGMTELLSQAWADGSGWFQTPEWMHITIRNPENPMLECTDGETGLIGVIDLANIHSCSFLLTGDAGLKKENRFKVLGRYHPENLRGCNFLIDAD